MNLLSVCLFAVMTAVRFPGATQYLPSEVRRARVYGADTKVVFHVVDDEGHAVKNASVGVGFSMNGRKSSEIKGMTDASGRFEAMGQSVGEVNYGIGKDDHYETRGRIWLAGDLYKAGEVKDGRWLPYGKVHDVVLKRKRNPIAMNAYYCERKIPKQKTDLGFDLRVGDFVHPYGKGQMTDFTLRYEDQRMKNHWQYRAEMVISFTNAFDGVYVKGKDMFSDFVSEYHASTNAHYQKSLTFIYDSLNPKTKIRKLLTDDQYLVLRTRTKVNDKGELVEAYYSKIYGAFRIAGGMAFTAYVNEALNVTNLEFNPDLNLQKNPPTIFEVRRP